tara:strand:- start:22 stop:234 length:213 start_codon:yes stop_codon:yes gene_type:complete
MKGEKHPMYGKHLSEETKRKISESGIVALNRPEIKRKMSGRTPWNKGKHLSEEIKRKMRKAQKARKKSRI